MAAPATPTNLYVQQGNGQVYLSWDLTAGATSYSVLRSVDNVTFASIGTSASTAYLDTTAVLGTQYFYEVRAVNGSGSSSPTASQDAVATSTGLETLAQIREQAQDRSDMLNNLFITTPEWNRYINKSYAELYDLLTQTFEDYNLAAPVLLTTTGTNQYALPDGTTAPAFYKLFGVDAQVNGSNWQSLHRFNFIERNRNTALRQSNARGLDIKYKVMGNSLFLIPTPAAGQVLQIWYIPRPKVLLLDTDTVDGVSGWTEYIIVDAAIKALAKQEDDVSVLMAQKAALIERITTAAENRDAGEPGTIGDVRRNDSDWGNT